MKFERQNPPFVTRDYRRYRQYTRADFRRTCAYCFRHENEAGGEEHFEQDHFEPKHRPNVDPADYLNLYWSCRGCNHPRHKGRNWPTDAQRAAGQRFCDPCEYDPVGVDYVENDEGELTAKTPAGEYTMRVIGLNRRSLRNHRQWRKGQRALYLDRIERLKASVKAWKASAETDAGAQAKCEKLERLIVEYESLVAQEHFLPVEIPPEVPASLLHTGAKE